MSNTPEGVEQFGAPSRVALLILGTHRSGTSALARMLSLLGATLPEDVIGSLRENEAGHREPERLVNLHEEMLVEAGSRWDDLRRFEPTALGSERLSHYRSAIAHLIAEEYGNAPLFVLKDPRLCRFVPFYEEILGGMGIVPRFILMYRNPVSVIGSLAARDDMAPSYASLVWLRHVLEAEEATRSKARVFLAYEQYLDDWRTVATRISAALGVAWPRDADDVGKEIDAYLSRGLQHHAATPVDQHIGQAVREAYGALLALTADDNDAAALATLSRVREEFESGQPFFADAMFEEMAVRQNRERHHREYLQRLVYKHQGEARKNDVADSDLEARLVSLRDTAALQATEIERLESERNDLQVRYAAFDAEHTELKKRYKPLAAKYPKLKSQNKTLAARHAELKKRYKPLAARYAELNRQHSELKSQNKTLAARHAELNRQNKALATELAALRDSISWRLTMPLRAAKRLVTDPRGAIALFHARGSEAPAQPAASAESASTPVVEPPPASAGEKPLSDMEGGTRIFHDTHEEHPAPSFRRPLELLDYTPKVSAIVPNYNHARFLEQRIDSILAQTYKNVEILILDDCSTDGSRAVIELYCKKYPDRIRALFNDRNSGNVFHQWRKGIENSVGELIWICESDDFCEPNFLEGLVKYFEDRSVNIAFGRIQYSDKAGNLRQGLDRYRESAESGIWDTPVTRPARRWFAGGFGVNNVIANVGGCIFRRQSLPEPVWREAENYSILGDWFLYSHLAGGGQIAYEPSAVAYFRQHSGNTSVASFVTPGYYEEHERLMLLLRQQWGVPDETVEAFHHKVAFQYDRHGLEDKLGPIESYCDKRKLLAEKRVRPHILIAFQGFHPGGGEVFSIHLANALRAQGHRVSMLALDMSDVKQEMLTALDPAIPVYDSAWVEEYDADRFLAEAGVSLIHSHVISVEWFFFVKCYIATKIPYLVTMHGSYESSSALSNERFLRRIILGVTHFVYTADKNLEPLRALPLSEKHFTKLNNATPVDPRPFPKTRQELGIAEDTVVFTLVARGIQRKGWRAAIAAFRGLREAHPNRKMHLLLCGEGEVVDRHFALHGADPDITFLGYQSRIHGLYGLSDVAIVPTRFAGESFPFVIIEALQTGTPVIATRIGEIGAMLAQPDQKPAGILIEPERDTALFTQRLEEAMSTMLSASRRKKFAAAARKRGESYDMEKVAGDYAALYENMLAEAAH